MAFTQLHPSATPGRPYSFDPKAEAIPESGPHTGLFTALSPLALPGSRRSFAAKTESAPEASPHTGLFTSLSPLAIPGMRRSFTAKAETVFASGGSGGGPWPSGGGMVMWEEGQIPIETGMNILDIVKVLTLWLSEN